MSHQPFETWILDMKSLPSEDRHALQSHLESCQQCSTLKRKWQVTRQELRATAMVSPAPGFAQRWQAGLSERRTREMRRQAWKAFLGFMGGAVVLLLGLVVFILSYSSPADWLAALIRFSSFSLDLADTLFSFMVVWLRSTPLALNIALWIYATITLGLLSLSWVFAIWRTSTIGVFSK
jgi:hypothetical protein